MFETWRYIFYFNYSVLILSALMYTKTTLDNILGTNFYFFDIFLNVNILLLQVHV